MNFRRHKYNVSPKDDRTMDGRTYASKAEMLHAKRLELDPDIDWVLPQVPVQLTPDDRTIIDFLVCEAGKVRADEVKGMETRQFKRIKKLWAKYAPFPMHVIRNGKTVEVIDPTSGDSA